MRHLLAIVSVVCAGSAVAVAAQAPRTVTYHDRAIVAVNAKLRFTTLIVLPTGEEILDFVCGDKDYWVVSGAQNLAYVKPAKAGATTNLNLITASGHVYAFLLTEGASDPDLALYVEADDSLRPPLGAPPRFYPAAQVEAFKRDAETARAEAAAAKAAADARIHEGIASFRASYPTTLVFPYVVKGNGKPFNVAAIYHDEQFTYIRASARDLPALYEIVDGTPNLIHFQVEHGTYIVSKVLDRGYLVIGRKTLTFERAK
jgi:type IV secretion system protein VirB9